MNANDFKKLGDAWHDCEYVINASEDKNEIAKATAKQKELEKQIDAAPFACDEDGNVIAKA